MMNTNQKQGILSLISGIALVILMVGIFSDRLSFNFALFWAISLWILAGVGATFFGIRSSGRLVDNSGWKTGLVALLSASGVIILLAGIFLPSTTLTFNNALIVAMIFWVGSGILASFLGVGKKNKHRYQSTYGSPYPPVSPSPQVALSPTSPYQPAASKSYVKSNYSTDGPAKSSCPKCGSSMHFEDTFCSNCGSSIHT